MNLSPWRGRSLSAITIRYLGPTLMTPGARPQDAALKTGSAAARDAPKPRPFQYPTGPVALPAVRIRMTSHGAERKLLPRLETAIMRSGAPSTKVGGSTPVILGPIAPRRSAVALEAHTTRENDRFCRLLPGCRARQSLAPSKRTPRPFALRQPFCAWKPGCGA